MYDKATLQNKIRIITHHMKERDSVAIGLCIGTGGRFENDQNKGAAHFLEHILFKGSKNYSCDAIKKEIEGVGGSLNAFTSEEATCYFAKIPSLHVSHTFDILADMVFDPLIAKKDVDKERTVILEEIKMYHDLPQYFVMELLDELLWPNHPLGQSLAGTFESIEKMQYKDLRTFHLNYYFPGNIVVAACGNIEHQSFVSLVEKKLNHFDFSGLTDFVPAKEIQKKPQIKFHKKEIEQMHLALGMHSLPNEHPERYALSMLNIILGGNMSSRLFDEVREKRGLAYSIGTSAKSLHDTGVFLVRAGVDNHKIVDAIAVILKELKKIRLKGVSEDEFTRARDFLLGQISLGLEDTLDHMLWMGDSILSQSHFKTPEEILKLIKKVKIEDIQKIAEHVLKEEHYNLAVVGPLNKKQESDIRKLF